MMNGFSNNVLMHLGHYVYALVDPFDGKIFYIGKGQENRVFDHAKAALSSPTKNDKLDVIRKIINRGKNVQSVILRHGLKENEAIVAESILIDLFSNKLLKNRIIDAKLTNKQAGHDMRELGIRMVDEIEAQYSCEPLGLVSDPIMIININKTYNRETNIYDATRSSWRISKKRADKAKYILSEYKGVIRAVFEMNDKKWQPASKKPGETQRYFFEGNEITDKTILDTYLNKSIHKEKGQSNPILYCNI